MLFRSVYKQSLAEGVSGMKPTSNSSAEFYMKFFINEKLIFSNFKLLPLISKEFIEFVHIKTEQDEVITEDETYKAVLNDFTLPPSIHRSLKTMNINGIVKIETGNVDKLSPYLPNERFKDGYMKPGDKARIFLMLKDFDTVYITINNSLKNLQKLIYQKRRLEYFKRKIVQQNYSN